MLLKIVIAIAVLIVMVFLFAATRPSTFSIRRSVVINASPEKIFGLINDFHNWSRWAPHDTEDPTMKRTYSGSISGSGAVSGWQGKGSTGKGQMSITESVPFSRVSVETYFEKPFKAHNVNEFVLEPDVSATRVTWTMKGPNLFMMKVMSIFVNMDRMMGKHFETGLNNLKTVAESS
jgi:uncharacterized protein YndB with AHSA1/START domain